MAELFPLRPTESWSSGETRRPRSSHGTARRARYWGQLGSLASIWKWRSLRDGTHAALTAGGPEQAGTLARKPSPLLDLSHGTSTRFAFGSDNYHYPVWSPDGRYIIFASDQDGPFNLYRQAANGVNSAELLLSSSDVKNPRSWSPDGRYLFYSDLNPKTKEDIWVLPLEGREKPFRSWSRSSTSRALIFLPTAIGSRTCRMSPASSRSTYGLSP